MVTTVKEAMALPDDVLVDRLLEAFVKQDHVEHAILRCEIQARLMSAAAARCRLRRLERAAADRATPQMLAAGRSS